MKVTPDPVMARIGERIRTIRKQREMSLDDVQRKSRGKFTASCMGAYERGFRTPSFPRLIEVAKFYDVPVTWLIDADEVADTTRNGATPRLAFDLEHLSAIDGEGPEATRLRSFVRSIAMQRGDWNGRVLTLRDDDLTAVMVLIGAKDTQAAFEQLRAWRVLVSNPY